MTDNLLNRFVLSQALDDLRDGKLRRVLSMGFTEETLSLFKDPEHVRQLFDAPICWVNVTVNPNLLKRALEWEKDYQKEIEEVDLMLKLGASSKMIVEIFGLTYREVAFRRRMLPLEQKQGRWPEITEAQNHELWRDWKAQIAQDCLDTSNIRDMAKVCMLLSQRHQIPMAMIWQAIEDWLEIDPPKK